jgi:biopolymer transport protein ExbB
MRRKRHLVLWMTAIVGSIVTSAFGQEPTALTEGSPEKTILDIFLSGGHVMWLLLLLSITFVSFAIEGFWKFRMSKQAPPAVIALLRDCIASGNYQQALEVCIANPCFLSKVFATGIERVSRGKMAVEDAIAQKIADEAVLMKANLSYISVIGVVSPMVGLTGTVHGMMGAFATLGTSGAADIAGLSKNMSIILVATLGGLIVSVPAFIFFYVLRQLASNLIIKATSEIRLLLEMIPFEQLQGLDVGGGRY